MLEAFVFVGNAIIESGACLIIVLAPEQLFPQLKGADFLAVSDYHSPMELCRFWGAAIGALVVMNTACVFDSQASYGKRAVAMGMVVYHTAITYFMAQRVLHFPAVGGVAQEYMAHVGVCGIHTFMGGLTSYWLLTSRATPKSKLF
ncbi:hypothetical protein SARC_03142 [Sphaeroforma arctica JP610]|uniref:Uncharacterized protein n=1 Tax=Sphaeroforma arctica JP610 TaxID=667725 RepID=A0A0L0G713_9EUKA|nr:hypothetical protein SARC_03142 [Sphaeroforma arctica JP610]KNC84651.1 hypothetical protein SARC_03142 [Sphaeroforma arctica JP610]|eukprot:XP_014158553.1 hypothetical protein SARC_03142 [Sphaeroforma arctica JP610]